MVTVTNLTKDFGPIRAVDNVSFDVEKGTILGFLGPNGAGKSTTMKMVTGFLKPTSGKAIVAGHDVRTDPVEVKKRIGYLAESSPAYHEMTVIEFLDFVGECRHREQRQQGDEEDTAHLQAPFSGSLGRWLGYWARHQEEARQHQRDAQQMVPVRRLAKCCPSH